MVALAEFMKHRKKSKKLLKSQYTARDEKLCTTFKNWKIKFLMKTATPSRWIGLQKCQLNFKKMGKNCLKFIYFKNIGSSFDTRLNISAGSGPDFFGLERAQQYKLLARASSGLTLFQIFGLGRVRAFNQTLCSGSGFMCRAFRAFRA